MLKRITPKITRRAIRQQLRTTLFAVGFIASFGNVPSTITPSMALLARIAELSDSVDLHLHRIVVALRALDILMVRRAVGVIADPSRRLFADASNVFHSSATGPAIHCCDPKLG